jgi:hypothetical protein
VRSRGSDAAPAPRLIPAETEHQQRTNIAIWYNKRGHFKPAIQFFVDVLQFELVEDMPSLTNDGRRKRWVVVRPVGAQTGILLARADVPNHLWRFGGNWGNWFNFLGIKELY